MNRTSLKSMLNEITQEMESIADEKAQRIQNRLLNIIEELMAEGARIREELAKLRDENQRLKGEQGRPTIRKQTQAEQDHSSEEERKGPKKPRGERKSKAKRSKIKIDRTEICRVEREGLPCDAQFKGYRSVIIQDLKIKTDNIEFQREIYYSPQEKKTYTGKLPLGYQGEFGPYVKALVIELHQNSHMTESAIHQWLSNQGIVISASTISRMLTDNQGIFHEEKAAIVSSGLSSSIYQQMDDTGARVKGKNYYTHILCNRFYTAFFTRRHKDRLTIIELLMQEALSFVLDERAYALMEVMRLSAKQLQRLKSVSPQSPMKRETMDKLLNQLFPKAHRQQSSRRIILEASALSAYEKQPQAVQILLSDDAPQYKQISPLPALCWVHDARHYKKLSPVVPLHQKKRDDFLDRYWDYYRRLLDYKKAPSKVQADILEQDFEILFSTRSGYQQLDERIEKTRAKKAALLRVLEYPELPLHNNDAELGARVQARYRDISFHTLNEKGTAAKDTFMTLVATARKLSVNTYQYILDRVSQRYEMPSLASLIDAKAQALTGYDSG